MAERIVSPGVFQRETDESFISPLPVEVGAAIIGPTVKGPVEQPTVVTSFSDYRNKFGTTFFSGSDKYEFLTSIAAQKFFANGGNSMLVTRVVSGTFDSAQSTNVLASSSINTGNWPANAASASITTIPDGNGGIGIFPPSGSGGVEAFALFTLVSQSGNNNYQTFTKTLFYNAADANTLAGIINNTPQLSSIVSASGTGLTLSLTSSEGSDLSFLSNYKILTSSDSYYLLSPYANPAANGYVSNPPFTFSVGTGAVDNNVNNNVFTLRTIGKGSKFNNSTGATDPGTEYSDGSLVSGSTDNLRWEVSGINENAGTFNLEIRRGDDNTNNTIILETYIGVNLDPESDNYISKRIGDQYTTITDYNGQSMVVVNGDNPNISRYVYVSAVAKPTPQYLNNDSSVGTDTSGTSYSASLPFPQSGSFYNGVGDIIPTGQAGRYFENISSANTQGLTAASYTTAINILGNKDEYRFNSITAPGIYNADYATTVNLLVEMCETRGDAFYVTDLVAKNATIAQVTTEASELNTNFAGAYWPWVQTPSTELSKNVWVPTSTVMQGVYAFNDRVAAPWFAPAGLNRGGIPATRAEIKLTQGLRDTLYDAKVNPIATFPRTGVVAFGQKTLQTKASALDRINVRRLLIALKNFIGDTSRNLVFEQNTTVTRNRFLNAVNPYLESVQQRQGLFAFRVIMDETNNTADVVDRNQLVGQILLQPTKTAEFIILDYVIRPTGASLTE